MPLPWRGHSPRRRRKLRRSGSRDGRGRSAGRPHLAGKHTVDGLRIVAGRSAHPPDQPALAVDRAVCGDARISARCRFPYEVQVLFGMRVPDLDGLPDHGTGLAEIDHLDAFGPGAARVVRCVGIGCGYRRKQRQAAKRARSTPMVSCPALPQCARLPKLLPPVACASAGRVPQGQLNSELRVLQPSGHSKRLLR